MLACRGIADAVHHPIDCVVVFAGQVGWFENLRLDGHPPPFSLKPEVCRWPTWLKVKAPPTSECEPSECRLQGDVENATKLAVATKLLADAPGALGGLQEAKT